MTNRSKLKAGLAVFIGLVLTIVALATIAYANTKYMSVNWTDPDMDLDAGGEGAHEECTGYEVEVTGVFYVEGDENKVIERVQCRLPDELYDEITGTLVSCSNCTSIWRNSSNETAWVLWYNYIPDDDYFFTDTVTFDVDNGNQEIWAAYDPYCRVKYTDSSWDTINPDSASEWFNIEWDNDYCTAGSLTEESWNDQNGASSDQWEGCVSDTVVLETEWSFTPMETKSLDDVLCYVDCDDSNSCTIESSLLSPSPTLVLDDAYLLWEFSSPQSGTVTDLVTMKLECGVSTNCDFLFTPSCTYTYTDSYAEFVQQTVPKDMIYGELRQGNCGLSPITYEVKVANDTTYHSSGYDDPCWEQDLTNPTYAMDYANQEFTVFDYDYQHHDGYGRAEIIFDMGEVITADYYGVYKIKVKNPYNVSDTKLLTTGHMVEVSEDGSSWELASAGPWWPYPEERVDHFSEGSLPNGEPFRYIKFEYIPNPYGSSVDASMGVDSLRILGAYPDTFCRDWSSAFGDERCYSMYHSITNSVTSEKEIDVGQWVWHGPSGGYYTSFTHDYITGNGYIPLVGIVADFGEVLTPSTGEDAYVWVGLNADAPDETCQSGWFSGFSIDAQYSTDGVNWTQLDHPSDWSDDTGEWLDKSLGYGDDPFRYIMLRAGPAYEAGDCDGWVLSIDTVYVDGYLD